MNKSLIFVAFLILLAGIAINVSNRIKVLNSNGTKPVVLSDETDQVIVSPTLAASSEKVEPTASPKLTLPTPTTSGHKESNVGTNTGIESLIYPGAKVISKSSTDLTLESSANDQAVTNWYKNEIKKLGYQVTSFVVTTTNGNVLNKLAASNNSSNLQVEIQKTAGTAVTKIQISLVR